MRERERERENSLTAVCLLVAHGGVGVLLDPCLRSAKNNVIIIITDPLSGYACAEGVVVWTACYMDTYCMQ